MPHMHICRERNSCTPTLQLYDCYLYKTCVFNVALHHIFTPSNIYSCRKSSPMQVILAGWAMHGTLNATTLTPHTRSPECVCSMPSCALWQTKHARTPGIATSYGLAFR